MNPTHGHTPRRTRMLAVLGVALATGLSGAMAVVGPAGSASAADGSQYGSFSAASGALPPANQCGSYSYAYSFTPPPGNWAVETTVTDPRGLAVSSYTVLSDYSPGGASASTAYQLCRNNTIPGVFTISGKMSVDDGAGRVTTYEMTPSTFAMTEAPKTSKSSQHQGKKHKHKKRKHHKKNRNR